MTCGTVVEVHRPLLENKDALGGHHYYVKDQPQLSYLNLAAEPTHFPLLLIHSLSSGDSVIIGVRSIC